MYLLYKSSLSSSLSLSVQFVYIQINYLAFHKLVHEWLCAVVENFSCIHLKQINTTDLYSRYKNGALYKVSPINFIVYINICDLYSQRVGF